MNSNHEMVQTHLDASKFSESSIRPFLCLIPLLLLFWCSAPAHASYDSDTDLLPDTWEVQYGLNPNDSDSIQPGVLDGNVDMDTDGLINFYELDNRNAAGYTDVDGVTATNPKDSDTDKDGVSDGEEVLSGADLFRSDPTIQDSDWDGLTDKEELSSSALQVYLGFARFTYLDPRDSDSDNDLIGDASEVHGTVKTDPSKYDDDNGGVGDFNERFRDFTNPASAADDVGQDTGGGGNGSDSDADGLTNNAEITVYFTDPNDSDSDNGGIPDGAEVGYGFNPNAGADDVGDSDLDGLSNLLEYQIGTNLGNIDSDGDGIGDFVENSSNGYESPKNADSDGDLLSDGVEDANQNGQVDTPTESRSNRFNTDTGPIFDGNEVWEGTNPRWGYGADDGHDSDGDGLSDSFEISTGTQNGVPNLYATNPDSEDSDNDGLSDSYEIFSTSTRPNSVDSDTDGLSDANELSPAAANILPGDAFALVATNPNTADSDNDGITDLDEQDAFASGYAPKTNPNNADSDGDGLNDKYEQDTWLTYPLLADSDSDSLKDGDEVNHFLTDPKDTDSDHDGLRDDRELKIYGTTPTDTDTDNDGLGDGAEVDTWTTNPHKLDSDGDGLADGAEVNTYGSDPRLIDSDGDGLTDSYEVNVSGSNPSDTDTDNGGISDDIEVLAGLNPAVGFAGDDTADSDADGLTNLQEVLTSSQHALGKKFAIGTDTTWLDADYDEDGISDGDELDTSSGTPWLTNPANQDGDNDGILDGCESGVLATGIPDPDGAGRGVGTLIGSLGPRFTRYFKPDYDSGATITFPNIFDSDTDGLGDGAEDRDTNGRVDTATEANPRDTDSDNDAIPDSYEGAGGSYFYVDIDGDGLSNAFDIDADSDTLSDSQENKSLTDSVINPVIESNPSDTDSDNDLVFDQFEGLNVGGNNFRDTYAFLRGQTGPWGDFDSDLLCNAMDADADGDGLNDNLEDKNRDGIWQDSGPNGVFGNGDDEFNPLDPDGDEDGINDGAASENGGDSGRNTDGDSFLNAYDPDGDGDGLLDGTEIGARPESYVNRPYTDTTSPNFRFDADSGVTFTDPNDTDSDNDGLWDGPSGGLIFSEDRDTNGAVQGDANFNGVWDAGELWLETNNKDTDTDHDRIADGTERGFPAFDAQTADTTNPLKADSDNGGISDGNEDTNINGKVDAGEKDPNNALDDNPDIDLDQDGLPDQFEILVSGTDPSDSDSDNDGIYDFEEFYAGEDGYITNPNIADSDSDGLSDWVEIHTYGTHPNFQDSDSDALKDNQEIATYFTNPLNPDHDQDGLFDGMEIALLTSPKQWDTDTGSIPDGLEKLNNLNPRSDTDDWFADADWDGLSDASDANDANPDQDGDGLLDGWETRYGTPVNNADGDGDGLTDREEIFVYFTNPRVADSDGDGLSDGEEVRLGADGYITDPRDADSDDDGLTDGAEQGQTTNPNNPDSDRDGLKDGIEVNGTNPTNPQNQDSDGDGLSDGQEDANKNGVLNAGESDPNKWDTDNGGAPDGVEVFSDSQVLLSTDDGDTPAAFLVDSDNDGLTDFYENRVTRTGTGTIDSDSDGLTDSFEVLISFTDPRDSDCDNDGLSDGFEYLTYLTDPWNGNSDHDGLGDSVEFALGSLPRSADSDSDGLTDLLDRANFSDTDLDNDGLSDGMEFLSLGTDSSLVDSDGDGLTDSQEVYISYTNPRDSDSDNDLITDTEELVAGGDGYITNPRDPDSDNDGLYDGYENLVTHTIPTNNDSDTDKIQDGTETGLTAPQKPASASVGFRLDADSSTKTDPLDDDFDNDGLLDGNEDADTNGAMSASELNPRSADSDTDGLLDGTESGLFVPQGLNTDTAIFRPDQDTGATVTNAKDSDSDNDGMQDGAEDADSDGVFQYSFQTDPLDPDSTSTTVLINIWGGPGDTFPLGGGVQIRVTDTDQNISSVTKDSVNVILQVPNTGDSETVTLYESGTNSGIFINPVPIYISRALGVAVGDGILRADHNDTLHVRYIDPSNGFETSQDTATILKYNANARLLNNALVETTTLLIGQSLRYQVRDFDHNEYPASKDSFLVILTSLITGDTHSVTLYETTDTSGVFRDTPFAPLLSDTLGVEYGDSILLVGQGDSIQFLYTDPIGLDTSLADARAQYYRAVSQTDWSDSRGTSTLFAIVTDTLSIRVNDRNANRRPLVKDTVQVTVLNYSTNDSQLVTLNESTETSGIFYAMNETSWISDTLGVVYWDGILVAGSAETLYIQYRDTYDATDITSDTADVVGFPSAGSGFWADTAASGGLRRDTFLIGDSLFVQLSDTDANGRPLLSDTVRISMINGNTGEFETVVIREHTINNGVFSIISLLSSVTPADSLNLSGRLYVRPGDTVYFTYQDPYVAADSFVSDSATAMPRPSPSAGVCSAVVRIGDSLTPVFRDTDQNFRFNLAETITVTVRNITSGEIESMILTETALNNIYFGLAFLPISGNPADNADSSGLLYAGTGDTLEVFYSDPNDPTDTFATAPTLVVPSASLSISTVPVNVKIGDSIVPIVVDTDQNRSRFVTDTIVVKLRNMRTGETETLILYESDSNSGIFDVTILRITGQIADSVPNGGDSMYAIPADTILFWYNDTYIPSDSFTSAPILVLFDTIFSTGLFPTSVKVSDSLAPAISDSDENRNGLLMETVVVTITNNRTGETELMTLSETDSNSGIFDSASFFTSRTATDTPSGNGLLYVRAGDTLLIRYVDRDDPTDSTLSGDVLVFEDTSWAIGTFPTHVVVPLGITSTIRDTDQNLDGYRIDTVAVVITNNRTGETETLVLTETDVNSGIFDSVSLPTSNNPADALSGGGTLYVKPGETVTIRYVDPNDPVDSVSSATLIAYNDTVFAVGAFPPFVRLTQDLLMTITDTDQNLDGYRAETVPVIITNTRTGESETLVLSETGLNASFFDSPGLMISSHPEDSISASGILFARPSDTLIVRYVDPNHSVDSLTSAGITVIIDSVVATVSVGPDVLILTQALTAVLTDSDQNFDGYRIETVTVTFLNKTTGETEILVLYETDSNSGIFDSTVVPTSHSPLTQGSGSGTMYLRASDTITVLYTDASDPTDSLISSGIRAWIDTVAAVGVFPSSVRTGDSLNPVITDSDQNFNAYRIDTITVLVTNNITGETEILTLVETDSNSGIFDSATLVVARESTALPSGSGSLYGVPADTVTILYIDPTGSIDSVTSALIPVYPDTSYAVGTFQDSIRVGNAIAPIVRDTDENRNGRRIDTMTVIITNPSTGETEILVLYESDSNSGIFDSTVLPTSPSSADSLTGNGTLRLRAGETWTVSYQDPDQPPDSLVAPAGMAVPVPTFATGQFTPNPFLSDSLVVVITDTDRNFFFYLTESVIVTAANGRTGEVETMTLRERASDSSWFGILGDTILTTDFAGFSASGDGRLFLLAGDTIIFRYQDPNLGADSLTNTVTIIYSESRSQIIAPPKVRPGDSVTAIIIDTDQNFRGLFTETVAILITNIRTGETELLVLTENGANAGYFGGLDTLPLSTVKTDSVSDNGRLYVEGQDTVRITYTDPTDSTDTVSAEVAVLGWSVQSEPLGAGKGLSSAFLKWGDYDRDGDPDLAILGQDNLTNAPRLIIYRNDGDAVFTAASEPMGAGLGLRAGSLDWGDFDGDGDLDLVVAGSDNASAPRLIVFRNTGGVFAAVIEPMGANLGLTSASVEWGDYDNDGDLDFVAGGVDNSARRRLMIFRNTNGIFAMATEPFGAMAGLAGDGTAGSAARWGDDDNDGDLDLLVAGRDNMTFVPRLVVFRNDNSVFTLASQPMGAGMGLVDGAVAWADVDTDGDLDFAASGFDGTNRRLLVYTNNGAGVFALAAQPLGVNAGVRYSSVQWGDDDNDGDVDLAVAGQDAAGPRFIIYRNENGVYTLQAEPMGGGSGLNLAALGWADYDLDGDLDLAALGHDGVNSRFLIVQNSEATMRNLRPAMPTLVTADSTVFGDTVTLAWNAVSSDTTIAAGLTYNLRVGTWPGGANIVAADTTNADSTGNALLGNVQNGDTALLYVHTAGVYYWAIQAVDGGQLRGPWSAERIFIAQPSTPSSGSFPVLVLLGDSLSSVFITDTDADRNWIGVETVTVVVTNTRTGETEMMALSESGVHAARFGGTETLAISSAPADSASGSGRLAALAGDTLTVRYQDLDDAGDSVMSAAITVRFAATVSSGVFPLTVKIGDSFVPVIHDTDQNTNGTRIDTVRVTVRNTRTGETEVYVLFETDTNSGVFDVTTVPVTGLASDSLINGKVFAIAADTLTVAYVDVLDPNDSLVSGPITVDNDTSVSTGVFPPTVKIGDSIVSFIHDTDQNTSGTRIDTITVTVTNHRTGETEVFVLYETDSNSGVFDITTAPVTGNPADFADNDTLYALAGDTLTVRYVDPTDPADSVTGGPIAVYLDSTPSFGVFPLTVKIGDSVVSVISDTDENRSGVRIDTMTITVTNHRTGETEVFVLYETDSNSGVFDVTTAPVTGNPADFADNDTLYTLAGDTLTVRYVDPTDPTDSVTGGPIAVYLDSAPSTGTFPTTVKTGDSIVPIIRDTDENRDGRRIDTITITVTNPRTGETEVFILYETDSNSGVFDVTAIPLSGLPADSGVDAKLFVLAGDTVTIRYVDPTDSSDSITGGPIAVYQDSTVSSGAFPSTVKTGDSIVPIIRDTDENRSGLSIDTITITVTNSRTGETEVFILYETDSNSGVFDVTVIRLSGVPGDTVDNDTLFVLAGDTLTIRYVDPNDPSDSVVGGPISVYIDNTPSSGTFPPNIRLGDSIPVVIRDTDQNLSGVRLDTIAVVITNNRTGETEILVLTEMDSNSGVFDIAVLRTAADSRDSVDNDTLYVLAGDTISITYIDPTDPSDSTRSAALVVIVPAAGSSVSVDSSPRLGDTLYPIVTDFDQNVSAFVRDTLTVTVIDLRTGETEVLVLVETDSNSGIFDATPLFVSADPANAAYGNGKLQVSPGDSIQVAYTDPDDAADTGRAGALVRGTFASSVQQINIIKTLVGTDSYRFYFVPTGPSGETLPQLDGYLFTAMITDSEGGAGSFTYAQRAMNVESSVFFYTKEENSLLFLRMSINGDTFFGYVILTDSKTKAPTVIVGRRDTTLSEGILIIPAGFYDTVGYRLIVEPHYDFSVESPAEGSRVAAANDRMKTRGDRTVLPLFVRPEHQFWILDIATMKAIHSLDTDIQVAITYPDVDNNGVVDGTPVSEGTLLMYYLDEDLQQWILVPGAVIDLVRNRVTVTVRHLTIFTLIGVSTNTNAAGVIVYPNPYRPNDGSADNGREYVAGDFATGILMDNVPAGSKIKVFTLLGERVMERTVATGGTYQWDVRNDDNRLVRSGVYLVVIEAPNGTRSVQKISVIR